ncbi:hypothetical protein GCM10009577_06190 [Streptomyces javensis]
MRIGEIAALVGVTSRTVRHYHHIGLLPEPRRRANGYRVYTLRDAVLLARIRRLTELGLSLDEVRDVLADDAGRELAEVLGELDADLARQEHEIQQRRKVLAALLDGPLTPDAPLSPALVELLKVAPATSSPTAAKDREHLMLLEGMIGGDTVYTALRPLAEDPAVLPLYERLDELEGPRRTTHGSRRWPSNCPPPYRTRCWRPSRTAARRRPASGRRCSTTTHPPRPRWCAG